jgi:uncharacterized membrane protein YkvA (DUF1232 family)
MGICPGLGSFLPGPLCAILKNVDSTDAFDRVSFGQKIRQQAIKAGQVVLEKALVLYFCLQDPTTPRWARNVIVGALAYFVLPLDLVADLIPGLGYSDDLTALIAAVTTVAAHLKPSHHQAAQQLLNRLFQPRKPGVGPAAIVLEDPALPSGDRG